MRLEHSVPAPFAALAFAFALGGCLPSAPDNTQGNGEKTGPRGRQEPKAEAAGPRAPGAELVEGGSGGVTGLGGSTGGAGTSGSAGTSGAGG